VHLFNTWSEQSSSSGRRFAGTEECAHVLDEPRFGDERVEGWLKGGRTAARILTDGY